MNHFQEYYIKSKRVKLTTPSKYVRVFILLAMLLPSLLFCQDQKVLSTLQQQEIILTSDLDTILLSPYSIIPNSEQLSKEVSYKIDYTKALFIEESNSKHQDTIQISYRSFLRPLEHVEKQIEIYKDPGYDTTAYELFIMSQTNTSTFDFDQLQVEGNIGRSLNFGNTQNLVVQSNLNLRLSGVVAGDVEIMGVLTDRNIPFEPQGDSRQIQELDQVYLQFKKQNHQITLGDYEYRKPKSYFLVLNKRLQGLNYQANFSPKSWNITTQFNGAVSRGKYAQNTFLGSEGNQGPYKLYGSNNESYIIILAGTERVYIDGVMQERGLDRDYTIDYNSGEIIFTSRVFITNRSRISVEFEYKDQSYTNSLIHNETQLSKGKWNMRFNLFTQQDSKNRINLSDTTLNTSGLFTSIGDTNEEFFVNSFEQKPYNNQRIQYRIVLDSMVNQVSYDSIFVYSADRQQELYEVIFTYVGEGLGDYKLASQIVNGRVFEWIAPVDGVSQGDYTPQLRLTPPSQQQMFGLTTSYAFSEHHNLSIETNFSNRDLNTLSSIGNDDNNGIATYLNWENKRFLSKKDSTKHQLQLDLNFERKGKNFRAIERYRPVEFTRNWNIVNNKSDSLTELYGRFSLGYLLHTNHKMGYEFSFFNQQNEYTGWKQRMNYDGRWKGLTITGTLDYLTGSADNQENTFFRPRFQISQSIKQLNDIKIGVLGEQNKREFRTLSTNLLTPESIEDRELKFFLESPDTSAIPMRLEIGKHYDSTPSEDQLVDVFDANEISFRANFNKLKNQQLFWTVTYRDLQVLDTLLTEEQSKNSILGRINYTGNFVKGLVKTGFDYEIGSGREPKREFSYIAVSNGEGNYIWNDYNGNGVQEISEFELSPFADQANFIRVFSNSNEYINVDKGKLNQWVQIEPVKVWSTRSTKGVKNFLSRISLNSTLTIDNRLYENAPGSRFFPYLFEVDREGLVSSNNRWTNRFIYNKLSQKFRFTYLNKLANGKSQLISGFEERSGLDHNFTTDIYFKNKLALSTTVGFANQTFLSENYSQKTFDFDKSFIKPQLSWIYENQLRMGLDYQYTKNENKLEFGGQKAAIHSILFDVNWNKQNEFNLKGKFNLNSVDYTGESNDAVAFSMLNGLQNGRNMLWGLDFEREVFKALKVNLVYDGRKLGDNNSIHTGRARFTATF